jgi:HK97 family phage prohead protease
VDPETLRTLAKGFIASLGEAKDGGGLIVRRPTFIRADSIDEKSRTVRMLASSESIDSYGDIVKQDFRLGRYEKNPVVLYGHNRVGVFGAGGAPEWTLPIGFSTEFAVGPDGLESKFHIVSKRANPLAELVWNGIVEQSIRACSIGFFPHEITEEQDPESGKLIYTLRDNELFEISIVPIGANPDAVALAKQRSVERAWFKERALQVRSATTISISIPTPSPEPAPAIEPKAATPPEPTPMTDEEKKALETAQKEAREATERALKAETELKAKNDADADRAADAEVDALVGKKIKAEQKAEFVALRKSSPEHFASIVKGLPLLPEADDTTAEKDVDALVGKKITPAQKADFVAFRKAMPELFKSITNGMLDLAHTKTVTPPDPTPTKNNAGKKGGTSTITKNATAKAEQARSGEAG